MVLPAAAVVGALVIAGRGRGVPSGLSRYGGVKICPSAWLVAQAAAQPPAAGEDPAVGQQQGDAVVVAREWPPAATVVNCSVAGSHNSAW